MTAMYDLPPDKGARRRTTAGPAEAAARLAGRGRAQQHHIALPEARIHLGHGVVAEPGLDGHRYLLALIEHRNRLLPSLCAHRPVGYHQHVLALVHDDV